MAPTAEPPASEGRPVGTSRHSRAPLDARGGALLRAAALFGRGSPLRVLELRDDDEDSFDSAKGAVARRIVTWIASA
jgi:hypothetical protein